MTTIKCPICKEKLSGAEGPELSRDLREHMATVHEMGELTGTHRYGAMHVPPSDYSDDSMSLREAEGPVRATWKESTKMWTSPPQSSAGEGRKEEMLHRDPRATTRLAERGRPVPPAEGKGPDRSGEVGASIHREGVLRVECPMCDGLITARDEEDLSDELRDHMADHHDIRPRRLAWIGRRA